MAEPAVAERLADDLAHRLEAVLGAQQPAQMAGDARRFEDAGAELLVELQELAGGEAKAQPDGDDAARRRSGDEVEIVIDRLAQPVLDLGQEGGGKDALDAAAIDGQDAPQSHPRSGWPPEGRSPVARTIPRKLYLGVKKTLHGGDDAGTPDLARSLAQWSLDTPSAARHSDQPRRDHRARHRLRARRCGDRPCP